MLLNTTLGAELVLTMSFFLLSTLEKRMVRAQEVVWEALPVIGRVRKHWYSEEYVRVARKARRLHNFILAWERGMRGR